MFKYGDINKLTQKIFRAVGIIFPLNEIGRKRKIM